MSTDYYMKALTAQVRPWVWWTSCIHHYHWRWGWRWSRFLSALCWTSFESQTTQTTSWCEIPETAPFITILHDRMPQTAFGIDLYGNTSESLGPSRRLHGARAKYSWKAWNSTILDAPSSTPCSIRGPSSLSECSLQRTVASFPISRI